MMHTERSAFSMSPKNHQNSFVVGSRSISPFNMHKTTTVFSRNTTGSNFLRNITPAPRMKQRENLIQMDKMSVDQQERFSRIVFDHDDDNKSDVASVITDNRIKIQDALNLIHGGNPAIIPPIFGSKEETV
jgi:hypothetical protein